MKAIKKLISFVLTAAILVTTMCVGTVTAFAADDDYSVKFYDDSKYYYVKVSGISEKEYDTAFKNRTDTLLPYICVIYIVDDKTYGIGNMQHRLVSVDAFLADNVEKDLGITSYYKFVSSNDTYSFYFRMPKSNKNAKKYIPMIKDYEALSLFFGLYDMKKGTMLSVDKSDFEFQFVKPVIDLGNSSSSTSKKKISSLEFDDVSSFAYTGKARKPAVAIYDGDYKLKSGTDYTVSYKNNKEIGKGTITVTGKGKYTGTKKINFNIVPKKPTIKVSEKSGKVTVSWSKITGAEKYQIYYSVNGGKYKKLVTTSKTSYSTSKLDTDDELKFKVRAYTEEDDEKYYSSFSKVVELK